jgi:hypothetical protein
MDAFYSELWVEANRKTLIEVIKEPSLKKREVKEGKAD